MDDEREPLVLIVSPEESAERVIALLAGCVEEAVRGVVLVVEETFTPEVRERIAGTVAHVLNATVATFSRMTIQIGGETFVSDDMPKLIREAPRPNRRQTNPTHREMRQRAQQEANRSRARARRR